MSSQEKLLIVWQTGIVQLGHLKNSEIPQGLESNKIYILRYGKGLVKKFRHRSGQLRMN